MNIWTEELTKSLLENNLLNKVQQEEKEGPAFTDVHFVLGA